MKTLTQEQFDWISEREHYFSTPHGVSLEERTYVYDIYNYLTGENTKVSSCGRCWTGTKQKVYAVYLRQKANLI